MPKADDASQSRKRVASLSHSLEDLYRRPGFLLRRANQIAALMFERECGNEITAQQFSALTVIDWLPGIDQMGVARIMGFDRSTVALVVSNLMKRDWISRSADQLDRRRYHLETTEEGRSMIARIVPKARAAHNRLVAPLSGAEQEQLSELLGRLVGVHNDDSSMPIDTLDLEDVQQRLRRKSARAK
jgi:DNA-binding MarR family transcriptional regulator